MKTIICDNYFPEQLRRLHLRSRLMQIPGEDALSIHAYCIASLGFSLAACALQNVLFLDVRIFSEINCASLIRHIDCLCVRDSSPRVDAIEYRATFPMHQNCVIICFHCTRRGRVGNAFCLNVGRCSVLF